jgi:hypothetical protein
MSQKKREECLSNALDVIPAAGDCDLANKYPGARFVIPGRVIVQTSRFLASGSVYLAHVYLYHYVLCEPRSQSHVSGIGVPITQVISLIDVTKTRATGVAPNRSIVFSVPHLSASQIIFGVFWSLRIIMILIYSVSICLITLVTRYFDGGEDGSKSRCVTLSYSWIFFKDDDSRTKVTTLLR